MFSNGTVQVFVTYSSKADFINDITKAIASGDPYVTFFSRNGNDNNHHTYHFLNKDGSIKPFVVQTADELWDGRDSDEYLFNSKVSVSSSSYNKIDARPIPRVLHLPKTVVLQPGGRFSPSLYEGMEDKDLQLVNTEFA
jgi:hypothetical protein